MRILRVGVAVFVVCVMSWQNALAGAPLKGIDVKLGKNLGVGARTAPRTAAGKLTSAFGRRETTRSSLHQRLRPSSTKTRRT